MTAELERRAHHDPLTGCYNRFYFESCLRELVDELDESERRHALCYIDLDKFKIVNDTCGHPAGDRLLCELTEALSARLRPADVFARLGGDEFGVIFVDVEPGEAERVAGRLMEHFQNAAFECDGNVFPVRGSLGLVEIGERHRDLGRILKAADIACYEAKDGGRNALVVFSGDDDAASRQPEEINWFPVIEKALAEDRFELLAQPLAFLGEGERVAHHELLLRLVDEEGERIAPQRFMRPAERYDLMRAIDRRVIERAVSAIAALEAADTVFSVNLCAQSVADSELLGFIAATLREHDLDPARLWFEIAEASAIKHFAEAAALCEGLHELGASIVLDDFGAGLSSFACLRDLPVDVLKIDGQFVREIATNPLAREIVRAMHQMARAKGIETVAENVEDAATLEVVAALGIDHAQGWEIGYPGAVVHSPERHPLAVPSRAA